MPRGLENTVSTRYLELHTSPILNVEVSMTQRFGWSALCRLGGLVLAVCLGATAVHAQATAQSTPGHEQTAQHSAQKFTLNGELALWTVAIKPDKTADFENVMARLRQALTTSTDPVRQKQAAGWKVMKLDKPLPDGNIAYVHVINPVVPGADYTVMQALYDAYPNERQQLYEMYRGAFAQNLSLAAGNVVLDMSKPAAAVAANAAH
jgi:hypothetical protein